MHALFERKNLGAVVPLTSATRCSILIAMTSIDPEQGAVPSDVRERWNACVAEVNEQMSQYTKPFVTLSGTRRLIDQLELQLAALEET